MPGEKNNKIIWLGGGAENSGTSTALIPVCDHYSTDDAAVVIDFTDDQKTLNRFSATMKTVRANAWGDIPKVCKSISAGSASAIIIDLPAVVPPEYLKLIRGAADEAGYKINCAFTISKAASSLEALNSAKKSGVISISNQTVILLNHFYGTPAEFEKIRKSRHLVELTDAQIARVDVMQKQFYSVEDVFDLAPDLSPQELFDLGPLTIATAVELSTWLKKTKIALGLPPASRRNRTV